MRQKNVDKRQERTRHYLVNDPRGMTMITIIMLLMSVGTWIFYRYSGIELLKGSATFVLSLYFIFILVDCLWVSVDQAGISLHSFVRKKKTIPWSEVCCCGFFYHYIYFNQKRKFFYISRKQLPGGINAIGLRDMPRPTEDFIVVAEQRDVEIVISQYLPRGHF